jgi:hypothetical protein
MIGMKRNWNISEALGQLCPGAQWVLRGDSYEGLEWFSTDIQQPTLEEIETKRAELIAAEPMRNLREIRDWYLAQSDWTQGADIRALRGPEWCAAWDAYRQALRDMPENNEPYFDENDVIKGFTIPAKPSTN